MELENPHRWRDGTPELGQWILRARQALRDGNPINLTETLPEGLQVILVQNHTQRRSGYQLTQEHRRPLDRIVNSVDNLLVLTGQNETVASLAAFWGRHIPIWEGHTRDALDELVGAIGAGTGDAVTLSEALVGFLGKVAVVLPDKSYYLIFLTFFVRGVNLESLVIVTAKENSEP